MTGDPKKDIESLLYSQRPIAFSRLADGERAILQGDFSIRAADGWKVEDASLGFIRGLRDSIRHDEAGYYLGLSDGFVDPTTQKVLLAFRNCPLGRIASSNLFVNNNHDRFLEIVAQKQWMLGATWVVSEAVKDVAKKRLGLTPVYVPSDVLSARFHPGEVVSKLLKKKNPIMVCAGPASSIIISEYWRYQKHKDRQTILDVGSAFDVLFHGRPTRGYHKKKEK